MMIVKAFAAELADDAPQDIQRRHLQPALADQIRHTQQLRELVDHINETPDALGVHVNICEVVGQTRTYLAHACMGKEDEPNGLRIDMVYNFLTAVPNITLLHALILGDFAALSLGVRDATHESIQ